MLSIELMCEISRRTPGWKRELRPLLQDACLQAAYCLDAPSEVEDGVQWWEEGDLSGPVPRLVLVRSEAAERHVDKDGLVLLMLVNPKK